MQNNISLESIKTKLVNNSEEYQQGCFDAILQDKKDHEKYQASDGYRKGYDEWYDLIGKNKREISDYAYGYYDGITDREQDEDYYNNTNYEEYTKGYDEGKRQYDLLQEKIEDEEVYADKYLHVLNFFMYGNEDMRDYLNVDSYSGGWKEKIQELNEIYNDFLNKKGYIKGYCGENMKKYLLNNSYCAEGYEEGKRAYNEQKFADGFFDANYSWNTKMKRTNEEYKKGFILAHSFNAEKEKYQGCLEGILGDEKEDKASNEYNSGYIEGYNIYIKQEEDLSKQQDYFFGYRDGIYGYEKEEFNEESFENTENYKSYEKGYNEGLQKYNEHLYVKHYASGVLGYDPDWESCFKTKEEYNEYLERYNKGLEYLKKYNQYKGFDDALRGWKDDFAYKSEYAGYMGYKEGYHDAEKINEKLQMKLNYAYGYKDSLYEIEISEDKKNIKDYMQGYYEGQKLHFNKFYAEGVFHKTIGMKQNDEKYEDVKLFPGYKEGYDKKYNFEEVWNFVGGFYEGFRNMLAFYYEYDDEPKENFYVKQHDAKYLNANGNYFGYKEGFDMGFQFGKNKEYEEIKNKIKDLGVDILIDAKFHTNEEVEEMRKDIENQENKEYVYRMGYKDGVNGQNSESYLYKHNENEMNEYQRGYTEGLQKYTFEKGAQYIKNIENFKNNILPIVIIVGIILLIIIFVN